MLLTRPKKFGESLTMSTLLSIFSGQKDLFINLAINKRLDEKKCAPRPVIHLDTSTINEFQEKKFFSKI
ncbi:MAG: AAA family ATPase [Deltaproteobacteria bacterium]|nr:AAA family ATPase [Deltaproteobacteria bacterium]